ncbi:protein transport protein SEC31-like [Homo sapiens]|uniref:protein transport protein SEC31-like n=1 Tax=Homo sapiens TaxID=9606 RepID=UPI000387C8A5|nr:protein transport protein SEC31-like [Homo sapiens]XP_047305355.1 protein transport protein SEC31-like [Homo sapiens]
MGSGRGETPSTSISIFPFTGGQDKSGVETWQRRPAATQLPVARMARRGGAASRAPSLLPPFAPAPRSSARLLGSGPGGVWAGVREERVAACPWSAGLQAPPAVPLSRAHPGGGGGGGGGASQPRSQPQGRLGTCSPARPTLLAAFQRLLGPLGVSPPYQPSEQSCWKNQPGRRALPGEAGKNRDSQVQVKSTFPAR